MPARKPTATKPRKPRTTQNKSLAPKTEKANPGDCFTFVNVPRRVGGAVVNEHTALMLGSVWACVRVIVEAIAAFPWHTFTRISGGRIENPEHPADYLLHVKPNPEMSAGVWRETVLAWAMTWGNGISEIERDGAGRPVALWPITPNRIRPARLENGELVYVVYNPGEQETVLAESDVFHVRGLGFDGLWGYSVIGMHARTLGIGLAADQFSGNFFENDSTPGGIISHKGRLSDPARANLAKSWESRHKGPKNQRKVAVLEEGMTWEATGLPPQDAQLLETRQFSVTEIARIFKVPPHKIGDLTRSTFSNIESEEISFVIDSLLPWVIRLEQEANAKMFSVVERGRLITKMNMNARLRADSTARGVFYQMMLDRGVFSINDVRALEDMNPIVDGEARFVPLNMQLLENAANPPEEPPPPQDQQPPPNLSAAHILLVDVFARVLRREEHRTRDAAKRLQGDRLREWAKEFAEEQASYGRTALSPVMQATGLMLNRDVSAAIEKSLEDLKRFTWERASLGLVPTVDAAEQIAKETVKLLTGVQDGKASQG